jgi:hypothetical protein
MSTPPQQPTLYERLGGIYSIATVIADLIDRVVTDARAPRFGYSTVMLNVVSMVKLNSSNVPPTWIVWLPGLSGASIR